MVWLTACLMFLRGNVFMYGTYKLAHAPNYDGCESHRGFTGAYIVFAKKIEAVS